MLPPELLVVSYLLYVDTVDLYEITIRYNLIVSHMKLVAPMPKNNYFLALALWSSRKTLYYKLRSVRKTLSYLRALRFSSSLPCGIRTRGILAGG